MARNLVEIYLGTSVTKLEAQASKYSRELVEDIRSLGSKAIREVSELALGSYLSAVPVDTLELRGTGFGDGYIRREYTKVKASVFVTSDIHYGRDRKPQPASQLVDVLQKGLSKHGSYLTRTKNSAPLSLYGFEFPRIDRGDLTAGWLTIAENNLNKALLTYTSGVRYKRSRTDFNPAGSIVTGKLKTI